MLRMSGVVSWWLRCHNKIISSRDGRKCIAIHLQYLFGKWSRRIDTLSHWSFVAAFQLEHIRQRLWTKNLAISKQKRQFLTYGSKCRKDLQNFAKMTEGTKLIASSPHSNLNISDNDSEQEYLAMSRQMKRQSSTDEPKAGPSVEKISKMSQKNARGNKTYSVVAA